jgi:hypothetical protein
VIAVFLLAAAAVLATAVLLAASLRLASPVAFVLAVWLAATGEIVLLTEILSPLSLARGWGYAAGEAVLLAVAIAVWRRRGSPRPPALPRVALGPALRAHPVLAFLAAVVALAFVYQAFIAIGTPPNNWDSLAYHLSRAAGWMQAHGVEYLPAHTERQNAFQPNAEIMILWTFAFIARDTFAAVPQLLAGVVLLVSVYGIGRRLGFSRPAALLPALLGATLTEIALQTVTTQNDLFAAAFVLACAYFALGRARIDLVLAGAALGLALGTKLTSVFALPVLVGLLLAGRRRQELPALLGRATAWAAAGFIVFGLYGYAQNLAETGRVLGDPSASAHLQPEVTAGGTVSTAARIAWRLIDTSGYHLPDGAAWPSATPERRCSTRSASPRTPRRPPPPRSRSPSAASWTRTSRTSGRWAHCCSRWPCAGWWRGPAGARPCSWRCSPSRSLSSCSSWHWRTATTAGSAGSCWCRWR